jgi:Clr5 domain
MCSLSVLTEMQQAAGLQQRANGTATSEYSYGTHRPHGPTSEEWDAVKDVIRQLYVNDQRPLKQVKEHLEANYNFHATYDPSLSP